MPTMSPRLLMPLSETTLVPGIASAGTGSSRTAVPFTHSLATPLSTATTRPDSLTSMSTARPSATGVVSASEVAAPFWWVKVTRARSASRVAVPTIRPLALTALMLPRSKPAGSGTAWTVCSAPVQ